MKQERHESIFNTQSKDFSPQNRRIPLAFFSLRSCVALLARGATYRKKRKKKKTLSWQLGQLITKFVPHITRKIRIFTKGFIKLSSQFIFSREQSTFVISYISLLRHESLTQNLPHLFTKSPLIITQFIRSCSSGPYFPLPSVGMFGE